jgi:phage terminase small subunit
MTLNVQQEAFCLEYIVDLNGSKAAIRAGYSEKTARQIASQLLTKLNIQDRIAELKEERSKRTKIDADWVLTSAKRVFDRCMQDEPVILAGEPTGEYKFDSSGANKALDLIGKHVDVQAFLTKQEISATVKEVKSFSDMYGGGNGPT